MVRWYEWRGVGWGSYLCEFVYGCIAGVTVGEFVDVCGEFFFPVFHYEEHVSGCIRLGY